MAGQWLGAPIDGDPLKRARLLRKVQDLVLSGQVTAEMLAESQDGRAIVREVVLDSWMRCASAGVDPARPVPRMLSESEAADRFATHPLSRVLPLLQSMLGDVADDARHLVVLSDASGLLLWADGHPKMLEAAAIAHFLPGGLCSEVAAGTNAVGTTLVLDHPVQVFSAEHFCSMLHGWTCAAAPIHDPATGRLLGAVNLSGSFRTAHPHSLSLITAIARAAESHLALEAAREDEHHRARYLALVTRGSKQASGLVDKSGRVVVSSPPGWLGDHIDVPPEGGRFTLSSGVGAVAEPLDSGQASIVWKVGSSSEPPKAALRLEGLGRRRATLSQGGGTVELSPRHSEILTLLALNPEGMSGKDLATQIYGSNAKSVSVRAEMSRLRKLLGCLLMADPYRLVADVEADFLDVERLLDEGEEEAAAELHPGPLLERSKAPLIIEARERIENRLRPPVEA